MVPPSGSPRGVPSRPWLDGIADPLLGAGSSARSCAAASVPAPRPCRPRWWRCGPPWPSCAPSWPGSPLRLTRRAAAAATAAAASAASPVPAAAAESDVRWVTLQMPLVQVALGDPAEVATGPTSPLPWRRRTAARTPPRPRSCWPRPRHRPTGWPGASPVAGLPERPLLDPRSDRDAEPRDPAAAHQSPPPSRPSSAAPPDPPDPPAAAAAGSHPVRPRWVGGAGRKRRRRLLSPAGAYRTWSTRLRPPAYLSMSPTTKNIEPRIATMSATRAPGQQLGERLHVVERRRAQLEPPRASSPRGTPGSSR